MAVCCSLEVQNRLLITGKLDFRERILSFMKKTNGKRSLRVRRPNMGRAKIRKPESTEKSENKRKVLEIKKISKNPALDEQGFYDAISY